MNADRDEGEAMKKTRVCLMLLIMMAFLFLPAEGYAKKETRNIFASMKTVDMDIKAFDASVFGKRLTMVSFWASWCDLCIREITELEAVRKEYAGRMNVVGVLLDVVREEGTSIDDDALKAARASLKSSRAAYPNIIPPPELFVLMNDIGVTAVPTTWFVDTEGVILYQTSGARDAEAWKKIIEDLLAEHLDNLPEEPDTSQYRMLAIGDYGPDVFRLKQRLYELGYYQKLYTNETYTESTAEVVKIFQTVNGCISDGIADRKTQILLYSDNAIRNP
jgi:thiol-disulfide isomerase/thioredoxin